MVYPIIKDIRFPFVVTQFDLSKRSNVVIHALASDYKVSSYGGQAEVKKISGIMGNPDSHMDDLMEFYKEVRIANNYGDPIPFVYGQYTGEGYVVGMRVALQEGAPAAVELDFLEIAGVIGKGTAISSSEESRVDDAHDPGAVYGQYSIRIINGDSNVSYPINSVQLSCQSKYSIINSKKNVIYYGDAPMQAQINMTIVNNEASHMDNHELLLSQLSVSRGTLQAIDVGAGTTWPITVMHVNCVESAEAVNYIGYSITALVDEQ